jgi:pimeloyl-ACP methyl ester carboxylesterase
MRVRIDDVRLFFDVEGGALEPRGAALVERPTLVALHGGPGFDHSLLRPWLTALADVAQVVFVDHRGNGRSDRGSTDRLCLERWGDDVRELCDALDIRSPIVLGVSFGGFVAQAYAIRHPGHAKGLVLCNTATRYRPDQVLGAFERLGGSAAREAARSFLHDPSPQTMKAFVEICLPLYNRRPQDPDVMARAVATANFDLTLQFFRGEWHSFDFRSALGALRCPTLVLAGSDDPITPPSESEDIVAAMAPDFVRLENFAGCCHPVYQDDHERFLRLVREFVVSRAS